MGPNSGPEVGFHLRSAILCFYRRPEEEPQLSTLRGRTVDAERAKAFCRHFSPRTVDAGAAKRRPHRQFKRQSVDRRPLCAPRRQFDPEVSTAGAPPRASERSRGSQTRGGTQGSWDFTFVAPNRVVYTVLGLNRAVPWPRSGQATTAFGPKTV